MDSELLSILDTCQRSILDPVMCSRQKHQGRRAKQDSFLQKKKTFLFKIRDNVRKKGIGYVCRAGSKKTVTRLKNSFEYYYYRTFKSKRRFTFQNESYEYFYHRYNVTWKNERAVEIPIARQIMKKYAHENTLEVGNVLSNYFPVNHDIVDKYEHAENVINQDAIDFQTEKKYDLIISISTLEHIGWDENPSDHKILHQPDKILHVIENLEKLLTQKGIMVITVPLGYNHDLDKLLRSSQVRFKRRFCLKRISKDNRWTEVEWKDMESIKYNSPFPAANGLLIGIVEK